MLTFRKIKFKDLKFINEIRNECSNKYLHDSSNFSYIETIKWYYKTQPEYWIILLDDIKIGYFRTSNLSKKNKNVYIGADIYKDYREKGFGYLSYMKFIPILFEKYKLHKISLEVLSNNVRAINLYTKIGFKKEGIKREEVYKENIWVDSIIMSLLINELDESL